MPRDRSSIPDLARRSARATRLFSAKIPENMRHGLLLKGVVAMASDSAKIESFPQKYPEKRNRPCC
jgi:hypothetical protein